ncbi:P-loop NTPase fold protein [Pseudidiomarina marina]|uniref:KAP NTPase domain-containing protein n=1 Tax=Pseudidiomarina marina TaxID=502366 RepID=A0A432YAA0_9GAMM|nr:P-loop NTPase fold protein [Pseudidiomarina marina]RUO57898.1 hypothetical protein CWI76_11595 [Pseudidiomarina marina]
MGADKVTKLQGQIFEALPERVSTVDEFDDQTHTCTADAMYKFINSSSGEGLTIGLEGSWGTDKSQVIA